MARAANGVLCADGLASHYITFFSYRPSTANSEPSMTNNHERNKRTAAAAVAAADCLMAACLPSASANTIASLHIKSITFPRDDDQTKGLVRFRPQILCSSHNLANLTEVVSAALELSKAITFKTNK
jgi:hypothetical protein